MHENAMHSTEVHEIQRCIRMLSVVGQILETFNAKVETIVSSFDERIFNEVMANLPNMVCLRVNEWQPDLSSYHISDEFSGVITYVLDVERQLCYVKNMAG